MAPLSSLFLTAALSGGAAPTPPALAGRTWVLTELAPGGKGSRVSGERPTLTVTSPTVTSPTVTSQGGGLTVYAGSASRLVFTAAPVAAAPGGSMSGTPKTPSTTSLTAAQLAGDWQLTRLQEGETGVKVPAGALLTFTASGAKTLRLSGAAGCNRLTGEATLGGAGLTFGPLASTRMFCEDMAAEQALTRLLQGVGQITLRGDEMTWRGTGGELTLTRRAPVNAADLGGTYRLLGVSGKPADPRRAVRLTFTPGQLGGFDGCNSFGGEYRLDKSGRLTAENLMTTLRACPDQAESPSLTALLGQAPTLQLSGRTLTLTAGEERWVFERE